MNCLYINLNISSSKFEGADLGNSVYGEHLLPHNSNSKLDLIVKPLDQTFCRKYTLMSFFFSITINKLIQLYMTVISLLKYKSNGWIDR